MKTDKLKCGVCGRFVSYADLDSGQAIHTMITPDSALTCEEWETLCPEHNKDLLINTEWINDR